MDTDSIGGACNLGEYVGGIWVPADPMDLLQCDSCQ